jgi:hypothetical protein
MLTQRIDSWQRMTSRQFRQVIAAAEIVGIGVDQHSFELLRSKACERLGDFVRRARFQER